MKYDWILSGFYGILPFCLRSGDTAVVGAFWDDGVKVNVPGFCNVVERLGIQWLVLQTCYYLKKISVLPSQQLEDSICLEFWWIPVNFCDFLLACKGGAAYIYTWSFGTKRSCRGFKWRDDLMQSWMFPRNTSAWSSGTKIYAPDGATEDCTVPGLTCFKRSEFKKLKRLWTFWRWLEEDRFGISVDVSGRNWQEQLDVVCFLVINLSTCRSFFSRRQHADCWCILW